MNITSVLVSQHGTCETPLVEAPNPRPNGALANGFRIVVGLAAFAVSSALASPSSSLSVSATNIITGQAITLTSTITDPEGNLANQAVDISMDGSNWTSGWDSWAGTTAWSVSGSSATNTVNYTPPAAGTYYFRSRGVDSAGVLSDFANVTVTVNNASNSAPNVGISVDGHNAGDNITRPYDNSAQITVRYTASDPDGNLQGIRYNVWNATTGYFDNGTGGFIATGGNSGEVDRTVNLDSDGDWYFWTDAQDTVGAYSSTGAWQSGFHVRVSQAVSSAPNVDVSVDGYNSGDNITRPYGSSVQVTVRYTASDPDGNLQGIRYNVWNATTGYFDNGTGGFTLTAGHSGEVDRTVALSSDGDWYFWTDAQDAAGGYSSTGAWQSGFHLHVAQTANYGYITIPASIKLGVDPRGAPTVSFSINDNGTVSGQFTFPNPTWPYEYFSIKHTYAGPGYVVWTTYDQVLNNIQGALQYDTITAYIAQYIRQTRTWAIKPIKTYQNGSLGSGYLYYADIAPQSISSQQYQWAAQLQKWGLGGLPGDAWWEYGTYNIPAQQL